MARHRIALSLIAAAMLLPSAATAQPVSERTLAEQPLAGGERAAIAGDGLRPQLTHAALGTVTDSQTRQELRATAAITNVAMDNWWAEDGAQLIAANLPVAR